VDLKEVQTIMMFEDEEWDWEDEDEEDEDW
jgi:hypothetical protein